MAATVEDFTAVVLLSELVDSDDEKPRREKTRQWLKRRKEKGYFSNIVQELILEDHRGFRDMFRMDVRDFQFVLSKISDLISPTERSGGTTPINADKRLSLTLRYLATGESLESLSFQFRICANAVSYIIKGCCNPIVEQLEPEFLMPPENKDQWSKIEKCFEERWNYPHALGAVDGKHILIIKPKNKGSRYYNYTSRYPASHAGLAERI
ncbi:uncharacterized protein [Clytia hemisphaerica]|uniref:uncharacterized protein n=1 Tax=Clytia hemisphaerica TaxID=252671 RepID=UPI0034D48B23